MDTPRSLIDSIYTKALGSRWLHWKWPGKNTDSIRNCNRGVWQLRLFHRYCARPITEHSLKRLQWQDTRTVLFLRKCIKDTCAYFTRWPLFSALSYSFIERRSAERRMFESLTNEPYVCKTGNVRRSPFSAASPQWTSDCVLYCMQYTCGYTRKVSSTA